LIYEDGTEIFFAHQSFKWTNLASHNAGVTVVIVGLARRNSRPKVLFNDGTRRTVELIGPYLIPNTQVIVEPVRSPRGQQKQMYLGSMAKDGGNLIFDRHEKHELIKSHKVPEKFVRDFWGASEVLSGIPRCCLWLDQESLGEATLNPFIASQIEKVRKFRLNSDAPSTRDKAAISYRFVQMSAENGTTAIVVPAITSENRDYLPVAFSNDEAVIGHKCYAIYDASLWNLSLVASRMHWIWIGTNTLGWNTFPLPVLTEQNREDLTACAEDILLAREVHFPATIADLYEVKGGVSAMPDNLRRAHERNDEVLERIYIGRRFKNDTERLEKLFELYTKMTATEKAKPAAKAAKGRKKTS
jgi:hypothetical protein